MLRSTKHAQATCLQLRRSALEWFATALLACPRLNDLRSGCQEPGDHFKSNLMSGGLLPPARDLGKPHQLKTMSVDDPSGQDRGCTFRHEKTPHYKRRIPILRARHHPVSKSTIRPLIENLPATEVVQFVNATKTCQG